VGDDEHDEATSKRTTARARCFAATWAAFIEASLGGRSNETVL
jgi:hypothetical protein